MCVCINYKVFSTTKDADKYMKAFVHLNHDLFRCMQHNVHRVTHISISFESVNKKLGLFYFLRL